MAQPLYFLPGARRDELAGTPDRPELNRQVLDRFGLAHVWRDVTVDDLAINEISGKGPGGQVGLLVAAKRHDGQLPRTMNYDPSRQEWKPTTIRESSLWIGIDPRDPVTAEDLQRKQIFPGYFVPLARGDSWRAVVIRRPDDSTTLPRDAYWDANNVFVTTVQEEFLRAWEDTAETIEWFTTPGFFDSKQFSLARALQKAIDVLAINYRYDRWLHNRVRAVSTETCLTILGASIDMPKVLAVKSLDQEADAEGEQKKTASAPG